DNIQVDVSMSLGNNVSVCRNLSDAGDVYVQNASINQYENEDCIVITGENITFDGNGHSITSIYNQSGIYSDQFNTTIKNCNVSMGSYGDGSNGIEFNSANDSYIFNNTVNNNGQGIYLQNTYYNQIISNTANDNYISSMAIGSGIFLPGSNSNNLSGNTINFNEIGIDESGGNNLISNNTLDYNTDYGMSISNNCTLIGNIIKNTGNVFGTAISVSMHNELINNTIENCTSTCLELSSGGNNLIKGGIVNNSDETLVVIAGDSDNNIFQDLILIGATLDDVGLLSNSINNTFINVSYDISKENIASGSELIRKWYYQAYVNDTDGSAVSGATVAGYNVTGTEEFNLLTNDSGWISRTEITEYYNSAGTRYYYSNYSLNASKNGYGTDEHSLNISITQNKLDDVFTLNLTLNITQVISINESDVTGGQVARGENVTINATIVNATIVDKVWVKFWETVIGGNVIWQGFLNFISGNLWSVTTIETNFTWNLGQINYTVYANDTLGQEVNESGNFTMVEGYNVTGCGEFGEANGYYTLMNDITGISGTCFNITAENITLDLNNYNITGDDSGTDYGVFTNSSETTVKHGEIYDFYSGIYSIGNNGVIYNNSIKKNNYYGVYLSGEHNNVSSNNISDNINSGGDKAYGIYITGNYNNLSYNYYTCNEGENGVNNYGYGVYSNGNFTILDSEKSIDHTPPYGMLNSFGYGIYINSSNNTLVNVTSNLNKEQGITIFSGSDNSLINITANSNDEYGIHISSSSNNVLQNIITNSNNPYGFYVSSSSYMSLDNITANFNVYGVYLDTINHSDFTNITTILNSGTGVYSVSDHCVFENIISNSSADWGLYLINSLNNSIKKVFIWNSSFLTSSSGFHVEESSNNTIENGYVNKSGNHGIKIYSFGGPESSNNLIQDMWIDNTEGEDVYFETINAGSACLNNTFLNVSFDSTNVSFNNNTDGGKMELIRKWYYQAYVNDSNGNDVSGANVSAYNATGSEEFNVLTNSSGWINMTNITDYRHYYESGEEITYYSNYTLNASKTGYVNGSHELNVTLNENKLDDVFTLNSTLNITQVITINESGTTGGQVVRGENVTINATIVNATIVDSVWVKIWDTIVGGAVAWQGFLNFISGNLWSLTVSASWKWPVGIANYTIFVNDTIGQEENMSGNLTVLENYNVTTCGKLGQVNGYYTLMNDITGISGTCFNITADNVTLDCQNNRLTGSLDGIGIASEKTRNITVMDCLIKNFSQGVHINSVNNSFFDNLTITDNNGDYSGIYSVFSNYNKIVDSNISINKGNNNSGIFMYNSDYNDIENNTFNENIITFSGGGVVYYNEGGVVNFNSNSSNNNFKNNILNKNNISTIGSSVDIYGGGVIGIYDSSDNNSFINITLFENNVTASNNLRGGGIFGVYNSSQNSFINLTFSENNLDVTDRLYGGGILGLASKSKNNVLRNIKIDNSDIDYSYRFWGGGILGVYDSGYNNINYITVEYSDVYVSDRIYGSGILGFRESENINISHSIISANNLSCTDIQGSGIIGGHATDDNCNITFVNSTLMDNKVETSSYIRGGGIAGTRSISGITFIDTVATSNNVTIGGYLYGGGILGFKGSTNYNNTFYKSTLTDNYISVSGTLSGGAVVGVYGCYNTNISDIVIRNNSISKSNSGVLGFYDLDYSFIAKGEINYSDENLITAKQSNNNIFRGLLLINATKNNTYLTDTSTNNTLLNISYSGKENIASGSELIRKWYYQAYVNDSNGSGIPNVNIYAYNKTGSEEFNILTNSSGWINQTEITEYINNGTLKIYSSNYTLNASKTGYVNGSHELNVTFTGNKLDDYFTLAYGNNAPNITYVSSISNTNPVEDSFVGVKFNVSVYDVDGVDDINDSSIRANFTRAGEAIRENSSCMEISGENTSFIQNYSCVIKMWYWDENGEWNVTVYAEDNSQESAINDSIYFQYNLLQAIKISPDYISFNVTIGTINQTANDFTTLNNTGNYNATGNIAIKAIDIYEPGGSFIGSDNFTSDIESGSNSCDGTTLQNNTNITVIGTVLERGNLSNGEAQEELYHCLTKVPSTISSGVYDTSTAGSWTIRILIVLFVYGNIERRRKKRKIKDDKLIKSFDIIIDEIKNEYSLNKKQVVGVVIERLKEKYSLSKKYLLELIFEEIKIPANIFSKKLGALEAVARYMKENLNKSYKEIADLLNRNERTVWTAYKKSREKLSHFKIKKTDVYLPISIFKNKNLTVLER
ncbi:hypothetical protein GF386_05865, partial [Candidatus Pacearchaeota archaeon]|nr:hypothetical protein [Candidatus Pacearchaeota archaeon]